MSEENITKHRVDPLAPPVTDWTAVDRLTDDEIEAAALADPDAQPDTAEQLARYRRRPNVRAIRERFALTPKEFARRFGLPLETVERWERDGVPALDHVAWVLLATIKAEPEAVERAWHDVRTKSRSLPRAAE